ncbi:MAG: PAS domain-containing protein [Proteobacteria bacterium]|nr:PAS domain-containing protein [Pseudomonadota bacterium]
MTHLSEKRLDDSRVLLDILDHLPTSIFVKDENLRFVYSNSKHCEIIDRSEAELLGRADSEFWPDEQARGFLDEDRGVIADGTISIKEEAATRHDGQTYRHLTRKARLKASNGKTYLIGTNSDVSEIRRRELQYKALSDTVPVAVAQIGEDGTVSFANPLFIAYSGDDAAAQKAMISVLCDQNADFPGKACKFEADIGALGGARRNVIAISSGWLGLEAGARAAIVSIVDISEMMELRRINDDVSRVNVELAGNIKRLAEAQDELVRKGRMEQLGQLTATVAHEIRNPLGSVQTSAFLLDRKLRGKGLDVENQLDRIRKGIARCDNIITQLLDFSRTRQLNCQAGDLDTWLEQVLEDEARKLPAAISISCDLGLKGIPVPFDPARLQRAIVNLLSNASEALVGQGDEPGTASVSDPCIALATRLDGAGVAIVVVDNGPGIPADILARIREPLFTTKSFGTGLGIPAVEQIARQHGGDLHIESEPGAGAAFTIWLPLPEAQHLPDQHVA